MICDIHPWKIVEKSLDKEKMRFFESLTSTGNGYMGMRGCFEEDYSGDTQPGLYVGGVWSQTSAHPEGQLVNSVRLDGIHVDVDGEALDLNHAQVQEYHRELDMQTGLFLRKFVITTSRGRIAVKAERFVSLAQKELLAVRCSIMPEYDAQITLRPYLKASSECDCVAEEEGEDGVALLFKTRARKVGTPRFTLSAAMSCWVDGLEMESRTMERGYVETVYAGMVEAGDLISVEKFALCFTNRDYDEKVLTTIALRAASRARELGYDELRADHCAAWKARWEGCDVTIDGDDAAQQAIRFSLFQLLSAYSGDDERLNVTGSGFTGDRSTAVGIGAEMCCLPVYLAALGGDAVRQMVLYRRMQMDGAVENARRIDGKGAVYPAATFTGSECEGRKIDVCDAIRRNVAIAHGIFQYATAAGDFEFLRKEGLDVLCGIARFCTGCAQLAQERYVIGDGSWFISRMAAWSIGLFVTQARRASADRLDRLGVTQQELAHMIEIVSRMEEPGSDDAFQKTDVLKGLYFLNHLYSIDEISRIFALYDASVSAEDPFSACLHSILAAQTGAKDRAMELYRKVAGIDLENVFGNTQDGLHMDALASGWLCVAHGFASMRTAEGLELNPFLPEEWNGYTLRLRYRGRLLMLTVTRGEASIELLEGSPLALTLCGQEMQLSDRVAHTL